MHRTSGVLNFGHMLGDEVIAIFRALDPWDLTARPLHVYLNNVNRTTKLYSLFNLEKPPLPLDKIHLPRVRCFERFVVGSDQFIGFMPREFNRNPRWRPTGMLNLFFRYHECNTSAHTHTSIPRPLTECDKGLRHIPLALLSVTLSVHGYHIFVRHHVHSVTQIAPKSSLRRDPPRTARPWHSPIIKTYCALTVLTH
jgi:hypothetical protein